jgi:putative IMPACT (imprinted ancient) family translation regulator
MDDHGRDEMYEDVYQVLQALTVVMGRAQMVKRHLTQDTSVPASRLLSHLEHIETQAEASSRLLMKVLERCPADPD